MSAVLIGTKALQEHQGRWSTAERVVLTIEHLGDTAEKMYHGQEIVGFRGVLRCELALYLQCFGIASGVEITAIVAVWQILLGVLGDVAGGDVGQI